MVLQSHDSKNPTDKISIQPCKSRYLFHAGGGVSLTSMFEFMIDMLNRVLALHMNLRATQYSALITVQDQRMPGHT